MSDITIKPLDLSAAKAATSRIDLRKATAPVAGTPSAAPGIRIGVNPARTTGRIDLSAIPGAQGPLRPAEPVAAADDIYKRRTALLDTSKIPLATSPAPAPAASAAQPRTIRIGSRPTIRIGSSAGSSTFTPGRSEPEPAPAEAEAPAPAAKPTIRLKRPSGASVSVTPSSSAASLTPSDFVISKTGDDEVGGVWTVCAILSFLVAAGVIALQVLTLKGGNY